MTTRTNLVRRLDIGLYVVELERSGQIFSFVFRVEGQADVLVVKQPSDFMAYMQERMESATPLMEAVLAFHRAQNLQL